MRPSVRRGRPHCPTFAFKKVIQSSVWLELDGVADGEWVIQDSYNGVDWRDRGAYSGNHFRVQARSGQVQFFRAARKTVDSAHVQLTRARQQWEAFNLTNYQYIYSRTGEFGIEKQLVGVNEGKVFETHTIETEEFWTPGPGRTIDAMFDTVQSAIDQKAFSISVLYHPSLGFPESIHIDYELQIQDEELSWKLESPPRGLIPILEKASEDWHGRLPKNYRYHLKFVTAWWRWEGEIEVTDGKAQVASEIAPGSDHIIRTMDEHFEFLRTAHAEGSDVLAFFDPQLGFPTFMSKDWLFVAFDGLGERYWLSDLSITD